MARTRGSFIAEQIETSTTSTPVSSIPFPNSNTGSTLETPPTSGEEEEELHFQKRSKEVIKKAAGTRQKRLAESDGDNQSVSIKPPPKRRAVTRAVYVEVPLWSPNVSVGIALDPTVFD
jgi:hypothetical protein